MILEKLVSRMWGDWNGIWIFSSHHFVFRTVKNVAFSLRSVSQTFNLPTKHTFVWKRLINIRLSPFLSVCRNWFALSRRSTRAVFGPNAVSGHNRLCISATTSERQCACSYHLPEVFVCAVCNQPSRFRSQVSNSLSLQMSITWKEGTCHFFLFAFHVEF
jgi:hypothetical protein